jgi:hypothetical protein
MATGIKRFADSFTKFVENVLDANDPLEIIVAMYADKKFFVKGTDGKSIDITPMITYQSGNVNRRTNPRDGNCNIKVVSKMTEIPNFEPVEDYHDGVIEIEKLKFTSELLSTGDKVLIIKTQKPVQYIVLGKIGKSLGQLNTE